MNGLTLEAALYVCARMREADRRCLLAVLGDVSYDVFAVNRWQTHGPAWHFDGVIFGLSMQSKWAATAWLIATTEFRAWKKLLRFAHTVKTNAMASDLRRIEAVVLCGWPEASRLVQHLGFELEGIKRKAGSGGEDFEVWSLTWPPAIQTTAATGAHQRTRHKTPACPTSQTSKPQSPPTREQLSQPTALETSTSG